MGYSTKRKLQKRKSKKLKRGGMIGPNEETQVENKFEANEGTQPYINERQINAETVEDAEQLLDDIDNTASRMLNKEMSNSEKVAARIIYFLHGVSLIIPENVNDVASRIDSNNEKRFTFMFHEFKSDNNFKFLKNKLLPLCVELGISTLPIRHFPKIAPAPKKHVSRKFKQRNHFSRNHGQRISVSRNRHSL
jgi:hypothetical protein